MNTQTIVKNLEVFRPSQLRKLFSLSLNLADIAEELLEENAQYSKEFVKRIKKSEKEFKEGKIKELKSFKELF